jgi:hypothetical protein
MQAAINVIKETTAKHAKKEINPVIRIGIGYGFNRVSGSKQRKTKAAVSSMTLCHQFLFLG